MKKNILTILAILGVLTVLSIFLFGGIYNKLVSAEEAVTNAWAQVENVYRRRMDLIPNLIETVRGYVAHERETLDRLSQARTKAAQIILSPAMANDPVLFSQFQQTQDHLSVSLGRLTALFERYPELRASQNFLTLQAQLESAENRISVERMRYNDAAKQFNALRQSIPNVFVARWMGMNEKSYFKAEAEAEKAPQIAL
ncbi:MAG: LemA family protein [Candidatus Omnitrophota bacterium]